MEAIDIKLLRDFQRLWLQALAIALVLACGVAILLTSVGLSVALSEVRAGGRARPLGVRAVPMD